MTRTVFSLAYVASRAFLHAHAVNGAMELFGFGNTWCSVLIVPTLFLLSSVLPVQMKKLYYSFSIAESSKRKDLALGLCSTLRMHRT